MNKSNPFPGMNPFMERRWNDVRICLIATICDSLGSSLPAHYWQMAERHDRCMDESWKRGQPPAWTPASNKTAETDAAAPLVFRLEAPKTKPGPTNASAQPDWFDASKTGATTQYPNPESLLLILPIL